MTKLVGEHLCSYLNLGTGKACEEQESTNDAPIWRTRVVCLCSDAKVGPMLPIGSTGQNCPPRYGYLIKRTPIIRKFNVYERDTPKLNVFWHASN